MTVRSLELTLEEIRGLSPALPASRVRGAVALIVSMLAGAWMLDAQLDIAPHGAEATRAVPFAMAASPAYVALLDPTYSLGVPPASLTPNPPRSLAFASADPGPTPVDAVAGDLAEVASPDEADPSPQTAPQPPALPVIVATAPDTPPAPLVAAPPVETIPFPPPRPPDFQAPANRAPGVPVRMASRSAVPQSRRTAAATPLPDNRSFFEKLFNLKQPTGPALAYAAPEAGGFGSASNFTSGSMLSSGGGTAVYDIAAHTVYMPNGARLEAHSGLGSLLDDPRHVNVRMRGATPPSVYDLQPRAQLFHGVQALRLNPVGNSHIFGRNGLLAHTYMLGPNGDSNGCVSFKDYDAFLRAYQNGEVKRLAVVASRA